MTAPLIDIPAGLDELRLTNEFATDVLGWKAGPGRFNRGDRHWIARSRFKPFSDVKDTLRVLEALTDDYVVTGFPGGLIGAEVRIKGTVGTAGGYTMARTISVAVARALGMLGESQR